MRPIHVGILLSYDYKYLILCISCIYEYADKITLAIDKDRLTWKGEKYRFDEDFLKKILENDPAGKIDVYEDAFAIPSLPPIECEKRERRMLRNFMGSELQNAWHLQIDTDEYFIDFKQFVNYLHSIENHYHGNITVFCKWCTIFKIEKDGIILTQDGDNRGFFPVASVGGCRFSPAKNEITIHSPFVVLHQSWGRDEDEIKQKILNWGHSEDFDTNAYFEFWKSINKYNARYIHDCHPLIVTSGWNKLKFEEGSIRTVLERLKEESLPILFSKSIIRKAKWHKLKTVLFSSHLGREIKRLIKSVLGKH